MGERRERAWREVRVMMSILKTKKRRKKFSRTKVRKVMTVTHDKEMRPALKLEICSKKRFDLKMFRPSLRPFTPSW